MARRSELLQRLKSLGPAFATTLTQEVFYKDFRNRREVASYFGLAPSPWQSGGTDRDQGISKAGNGSGSAHSMYQATQEHSSDQSSGSFDCKNCKTNVLKWSGVYDYSRWTLVPK